MARTDIKELDLFIENKMKALKMPGLTVAIRGPEGVIFEKGYGVRDREMSVAPDENTICGIASMGKSMAGLACAILAAEGRLSLEDPVFKYILDFHIPGNPDSDVTVRSLLTHTAGIPPMEPLEWSIAMNTPGDHSEWAEKMRATSPNQMDRIEQIVEYIANCPYETLGAPGEIMSYSNEGYAVICYVVDAASGMPIEKFLDERVFKPIGMTRSVLDEDAKRAREIASDGNITSLFEKEDGKLVSDDDWSVLPPFRACACVKSTAHDMARYYHCLANKGMIDGIQAIPAEAVEIMIGEDFPTQEKEYYCLGLEKRLYEGHVILAHSGGLHGVSSEGALLKDEGYGFAALCNEGDNDASEIISAMLNYIMEKPLDNDLSWLHQTGEDYEQPDELTGRYICHEGIPAIAEFYTENGMLKVDRDGEKYDLANCGGTWFRILKEGRPVGRCHFHIRDGKAWGVQIYTRVYRRMEEKDERGQ